MTERKATLIRVQTQDFDIGTELRELTRGLDDIGAAVTFTGMVRSGSGPGAIDAMTLEHYPGMTEKELQRIENEALARWPLQGSLIVHRYGRLLPGDTIVLVITLSKHRQAAFEAASFLMDFLKTHAPFWKKEELAHGASAWVQPKDIDNAAEKRWNAGG